MTQRKTLPDMKEKLDRLANMQSALDMMRLHYNDQRRKIIPNEIWKQLEDLKSEELTSIQAANAAIAELRSQIEREILIIGETQDGEHLQAIYNNGRLTWKGKELLAYSKTHPEILKYRKYGDPYVTIKPRGSKSKTHEEDSETS